MSDDDAVPAGEDASGAERYARRRAALGAELRGRGLDAALVTRLVNVRYLTGLDSSNAALLAGADGSALLATDSRYAQMARSVCPELALLDTRQIAPALAEVAAERGHRAFAVEEHEVTLAVNDVIAAAAPQLSLHRLHHAVERLRVIKDDGELALLRRACELTDAALADVLPRIRPGVTERELALALERRMVELGADAPAFDSIVAAGENGAVPHHHPGDRPIAAGDLVTMDFGARYGGYHADMTRTVAVGEPAAWQRELYDLVASAQRAGRGALRPGADPHAVDAVARDLIGAAGHADHFGHGLGHGVGLEVHEDPFLSPRRTAAGTGEAAAAETADGAGAGTLAAGVPITVEPGVYLPERGGVRIEDTLVITEAGAESLTTTTRKLLVL